MKPFLSNLGLKKRALVVVVLSLCAVMLMAQQTVIDPGAQDRETEALGSGPLTR